MVGLGMRGWGCWGIPRGPGDALGFRMLGDADALGALGRWGCSLGKADEAARYWGPLMAASANDAGDVKLVKEDRVARLLWA